jgi:hypothetical protein
MISGFAQVAREFFRARGDGGGLEIAAVIVGHRNLGDRADNARVGAPRHSLRGRRIIDPCEHDAIG